MTRIQRLRADFSTAITTALGPTVKIYYGQPIKPVLTYPQCVVRFGLDRKRNARQIEETWQYEIEIRLALNALGDDTELTLYEKADLVIQQIQPFTEDPAALSTIPKPQIRLNWEDPQVSAVTPRPAEDNLGYRAVRLSGQLSSRVLS